MSSLWFLAAILLALVALWLALVWAPNWRLKRQILARLHFQPGAETGGGDAWLSALAARFTEHPAICGDYNELGEAFELTGRTEGQAQIDYLLMCWLLPALVIVAGFALGGAIWGSLVAVMGFLFPRRVIRAMAVTAEKQQNLEAVELCHMTRMLLESGLSIERALRLVAAQARPIMPRLCARLDRFNRMMEAGADRSQALNELGRNKRILVLRNYVNLMKQSSKLGAKVSHSLDQIIEEAQRTERSRLKEETNRIGAKMTVIMMAFMLPALFTLIGGPAVISIAETLGR